MPNLRIPGSQLVADALMWIAFILGVFGAFALAGTAVGEWIGKTVGHLPV